MHGVHDAKLTEPFVRDLTVGERLRDDADDLGAARERRFGHVVHEADAGPAIDEPHARFRDGKTEITRGFRVPGA